jgi:ureidoacrylate peracid hydrolase
MMPFPEGPVHDLSLDSAVVTRARQRRGGDYAFSRIEPVRTALLAIDLQNWTMDRASPTYIPRADLLAGPVNSVARVLRARGGTVVWAQMEASDSAQQEWGVFYDGVVKNARDAFVSAMRPGSHWHQIFPHMQVESQDIISPKTRYSCLLECSSRLDAVLRGREIDTVLIAGVATNVCCESTARDAMMMGYRVIVLSDGCACRSDREHNASLSSLMNMFADIRTCESIIELLQRSGSPAPSRAARGHLSHPHSSSRQA